MDAVLAGFCRGWGQERARRPLGTGLPSGSVLIHRVSLHPQVLWWDRADPSKGAPTESWAIARDLRRKGCKSMHALSLLCLPLSC